MPDGFFTAEPLGKPVIVAFFKKKKKLNFGALVAAWSEGLPFILELRLLIAVASLAMEHRLWGCGLHRCSTQVQ